MSGVSFEAVTKRFGPVVAVDDLDLTVHDQELMVLVGPSGCGKTTALRILAGLDDVTEGTVRIGDRVVNHVDPRDRDIAMVFQSYALYPHMTVFENIESPLAARAVRTDDGPARRPRRAERAPLVREAAGLLGLTDLLDRKPAALSGGQRQRVALARAIVRRPAAFLMDEPLSNLDATLRAQTRAELVELHRRLGTTFVFVTHDQVEAMTMATRIAVMDSGKLQQVDDPQTVYDRPANLFVARFIGSPPMNTLEGTIARSDDGTRATPGSDGTSVDLATHGGALPLTVPAAPHGTPVVVGVRPEHLVLGGGTLPATVAAVELLGHERHVLCDTRGGARLVVRCPSGAAAPAAGEAVRLGARPEHLHLFDAATGNRMAMTGAPT